MSEQYVKTYLDCGAIGEVEVTVFFDFDKGQKLIINPIEEAQEGIPPHVIINEVTATIDNELVNLLPLINDCDCSILEETAMESLDG